MMDTSVLENPNLEPICKAVYCLLLNRKEINTGDIIDYLTKSMGCNERTIYQTLDTLENFHYITKENESIKIHQKSKIPIKKIEIEKNKIENFQKIIVIKEKYRSENETKKLRSTKNYPKNKIEIKEKNKLILNKEKSLLEELNLALKKLDKKMINRDQKNTYKSKNLKNKNDTNKAFYSKNLKYSESTNSMLYSLRLMANKSK